MLKIRLSRVGKKRQPAFRVVVQEHTSSAKGKFIEELGFYRPATIDKEFKVNIERVKYWLSVGAQPSDAVAVLLKKDSVEGMDRFIEPRDKKKKKKGVQEEPAPSAQKTEAPAAEASAEKPAPEEPKAAPAEESPAPSESPKAEEAPVEAPKAEEAPAEEPKQ